MKVRGFLGAALLIAVVTAVARVVGFGRWLVFSGSVGANSIGSAYSTANQVPNVLFEVAAGGALAAAVVPLLAGPLARGVRDDVDRIASALLTWSVVVLLPLSLGLALLAGPITGALLGERAGADQRGLALRLLLVFAPQVVLYGIGVVLGGVLQAHRRFLAPAVAPLVSSTVMIGGYLGYARAADGASTPAQLSARAEAWLGWGTTAAVAAMTLPLIVPVLRCGVRLRPTLGFPPGVARRGVGLVGAGVAVLLAQQVAVLAAVRLANWRDPYGALNVFQYTQAVYLLPYAVLAVPLATSAFPRLAERVADADRPGFARVAAGSTRAVVLAGFLGVAALLAAAPSVAALFAAIDTEDVTGMAPALLGIAPGLVGFALVAHLGRALYALEEPRAAVVATAAGWLLVVLASVLAVAVLPATSVVLGLALGNTAGMLLAGALLLIALRRVAGAEALAGAGRATVLGLIGVVVGGGLGSLLGRLVDQALVDRQPGAPVLVALCSGGAAGAAALAGFLAVLAVLGRTELAALRTRGRVDA